MSSIIRSAIAGLLAGALAYAIVQAIPRPGHDPVIGKFRDRLPHVVLAE